MVVSQTEPPSAGKRSNRCWIQYCWRAEFLNVFFFFSMTFLILSFFETGGSPFAHPGARPCLHLYTAFSGSNSWKRLVLL